MVNFEAIVISCLHPESSVGPVSACGINLTSEFLGLHTHSCLSTLGGNLRTLYLADRSHDHVWKKVGNFRQK